MRVRNAVCVRLVCGLVTALIGCAPLPPPSTGAPVPPARASHPAPAPVGGHAAAGGAQGHAATRVVPADSLPSAAALDVLKSIPDPLSPGERVAPPDVSTGNAGDTDTTPPAADVPVPAPTPVLGERRPVPMDTTTAAAPPPTASAPPASPPAAAPPPAASSAAGDTCWRVQVLAPLTADEAEQARSTASSLLLVPMVVEKEAGRYKVRTQNCLTRDAADLLKRRAVDSGFTQAFRISGRKP